MYNRGGLLSLALVFAIGALAPFLGVPLEAAGKKKVYPMHAWLDKEKTITLKLGKPLRTGEKAVKDRFKLVGRGDKKLEITDISFVQKNAKSTDLLKLHLKNPLDVEKLYFVKSAGYEAAPVVPRYVLNDKKYFYDGKDLGSVYSPQKTAFRIWAPTASSVSVVLFDYPNSDIYDFYLKQPLNKDVNGTWNAAVWGDLKDKYYLYEIRLYVNGKITEYLVADPYSRASAVNSKKTLIFDPKDVDKAVPGWGVDEYVKLDQNVDAVIYEVHVRDFTISHTSEVKPEYRGKYLGLAQRNTLSAEDLSTGFDAIRELGVTHVQLLPTFDYGAGDEAEANALYTWYVWGYSPVLYNNVEGSYATNPNDIARLIEYKKMIQTFHEEGLGVMFDAVFSHTFETGGGKLSIFDKIVPYYFYRINDDGTYSNGSFYGNELATERPMVRKFILDSVKYFTKEYHVDGFRFDLMGLMDKETMIKVHEEIKKVNPNAIICGEGWEMPTVLPVEDCMTQGNVEDIGIAAFNDGFRDNLRGDVFKFKTRGFVQDSPPMTGMDRFKNQIKGQDTGRGKEPISVTSPNAYSELCVESQ